MAERTEARGDAAVGKRDDQELGEFFERLGRAVTSGDGAAAAALWETPAFILGDEMAQVVGSPAELAQFFGGAKEQYNARGIVDTYPDIQRVDWLTGRIVVVEVRWPYLDASGGERGEERSSYTLHRGDDGALRLRIAVMQGEKR